MLINSILETVGNTPMLKLNRIEKEYSLKASIFAKLEKFNPAGSAKDRVAIKMLDDAISSGKISEGATIIEPTSGNTGIGLALASLCKGFKMILVMPDTMSKERINIVKAYGAEVVLTKGEYGMKGCIDEAERLHSEIPNSFIPAQFDNLSNPEAHYITTAPEIYEDLGGKIDIFIATIGTGGTISGIAKYLKEKNPAIKIIGIEPSESPLISKGVSGSHGIQGIGANFIPKILDLSLIDEIIPISTEESYEYAKIASLKEGIQVGISSGAALAASIMIAKREENINKNIVTMFPDGGDRYYSTKLYNE